MTGSQSAISQKAPKFFCTSADDAIPDTATSVFRNTWRKLRDTGDCQWLESERDTVPDASPAARFAAHSFRARIEAPSAWDSSVVTLFVVEALIAAVQNATWSETRERMRTLEELFDQTKIFRKFV